MMKRKKTISVVFYILTLLIGMNCYAQKKGEVDFAVDKYSFVHAERNMITSNPAALDTFFEKLYQQKTKKNQTIKILQIGDSHIQADFLSNQVRTDFQNDFGNAGRGLVVPLRVAGSNEPYNYKITSNVQWAGKRIVHLENPMPIGIGGSTIQTSSDSAYLAIKVFNSPTHTYEFTKGKLFFLMDSSYNFRIEDSIGNEIAGSIDLKSTNNVMTFALNKPISWMGLRAVKANSNQNQATIFGLELLNDSAGVVYSSVGANGAEAFQFVQAKYFAEQTSVLNSDLIIISLGTNEGQHRPLDRDLTYTRLDSMVKQLQQNNPNVPILLTTPTDSYYHRKYFNPSVAAVHEVIVDYAKDHNLPCWDLFSIAGGYKSAYQWKKNKLMGPDGVHFGRRGYEFQGNLMYDAIIKAYNHYVAHRPK